MKFRLSAFIVLFLAQIGSLQAQRVQPLREFTVHAADGVAIAAQEWGNPDGPEIVFVHGLLGSHLSWRRQLADPSLQRFHIVTYDLRGHALSGKPAAPSSYRSAALWGEELHAVIAGAGLHRPVLVGWSMGGVVIDGYLQRYGDQQIAGVNFVDAVIELKPELMHAHPQTTEALLSPDLEKHVRGIREFVAQCFASQPRPDLFTETVAIAAMASPIMTNAVYQGIDVNAVAALAHVKVPVLFSYGERDALMSATMVDRAVAIQPAIVRSAFPGAGHSPFMEDPARFDRELAAFVERAAVR